MAIGASITALEGGYKTLEKVGLIKGESPSREYVKFLVTYKGGLKVVTCDKNTGEPFFFGRETQAYVDKKMGFKRKGEWQWDYYRDYSSKAPSQPTINWIHRKYGSSTGNLYGTFDKRIPDQTSLIAQGSGGLVTEKKAGGIPLPILAAAAWFLFL